ncbi:DUF3310 domain-containing protein [Staphylococcus cohnii]
MNISDLKIGKYVVVNDLGASKYSSGMRVIGKVVSVDPCGNSAIIESLPKHRYEITDFNDFELWSKQIEDKTERMGLNKQTNDLQQRKRKDNVNSPSHYNYGEIETIDYCDQVCKTYPPELAPYVFNAIKYLSRANHKNGREDIDKAKYYVQRLFDKWE